MEETWKGFAEGDRVTMINPTTGDDSEGRQRTYKKGTPGRIDGIRDFGPVQGRGVDVVIGGDTNEEAGKAIVYSIDDRDVRDHGMPFRRA